MQRPKAFALAMLAAIALLTMQCDEDPEPAPTDGDVDGDADGDSDADGDADGDVEGGPPDGDADDASVPPGPFTLLVERVAVTTDRLCDLDGDGDLDNALADLGTSAGEMTAITLSTVLQSRLDELGRVIIHIPDVADPVTPHDDHVVTIIFDGVDLDDPEDPSDDFSGEEPFAVQWDYLDACGEPLYYFTDGAIDDGELTAIGGVVVIDLPSFAPLFTSSAFGTIEAMGRGGEVSLCGYGRISELGSTPGFESVGELTLLELLLAGGAPLGIPALPGLAPDVDLDRDGLESFVLDADGHIVSCVDGDHIVIDGRDCWRDERMADGFALSLHVSCTTAVVTGPQEGWEDLVEGTCTDPPVESLWGKE